MLVPVGLQRDALVQEESAGAVDAAAQDDGVARHDLRDRRLERRRLVQRIAGRIGSAVGRDVVDVRRLGHLVGLLDRAIGPPDGCAATGATAPSRKPMMAGRREG